MKIRRRRDRLTLAVAALVAFAAGFLSTFAR
jgi:hypothetical protein